jgi:hypothetical protein
MAQDTEKNKQQSNQNPGNQQDTSWKQQPGNPRKDPQQGSGDYGNQRDQQDQDKKRRAS